MRLLEGKLKLKVNREKSAVARPWERKFLGFSFTNGSCRSAEARPKLCPGSRLESEPLLFELGASAPRPWFASWAATFRDGRAISASARLRPCWTVSITGLDVVYARLPASNGEQGKHDTLDCGSSV